MRSSTRAATTCLVSLVAIPLLSTLAAGTAAATAEAATPWQDTGMQELRVRVDGLSCPFCAYGLEKKLKGVEHVESVEIELQEGRAVIQPESGSSIDLAAMRRAVERAGFTAREVVVEARGRLSELDGAPVLSLPGGVLLLLGDDEQRQALLSEVGGTGGEAVVTVKGVVEFDHTPDGHAGHPLTLKIESFQV